MKKQQLIDLIKKILVENPDFFDGFTTKELIEKFQSVHNVKPSTKMLNDILVELTDAETETGDERTLARGDEHDYGDTGRFKGIHRYCWFLT